jgi:hypothetical protein
MPYCSLLSLPFHDAAGHWSIHHHYKITTSSLHPYWGLEMRFQITFVPVFPLYTRIEYMVISIWLANDTDLVIASSTHTSSANAYMSAFHLLMREAIQTQMPEEKWKRWGETIPEAALAILKHTGRSLRAPRNHPWDLTVAQLEAALSFVFGVNAALA